MWFVFLNETSLISCDINLNNITIFPQKQSLYCNIVTTIKYFEFYELRLPESKQRWQGYNWKCVWKNKAFFEQIKHIKGERKWIENEEQKANIPKTSCSKKKLCQITCDPN